MKNIKRLIFAKNIRITLALFLFAATLVLSLTMYLLKEKVIMVKSTVTLSQEFQNMYSVYSNIFNNGKKIDHAKWMKLIAEKTIEEFKYKGYKYFDYRLSYFPDILKKHDKMFSLEKDIDSGKFRFFLIVYLVKEHSSQEFVKKNGVRNILLDVVRRNSPLDPINGLYDSAEIYAEIKSYYDQNNNIIGLKQVEHKYLELINKIVNQNHVNDRFPLQIIEHFVEKKAKAFFIILFTVFIRVF